MTDPIDRRRFLTAVGGATGVLMSSQAIAGANSRIRCGIIGVGGRGTHLLRLALSNKDVQIAAVCDIEPAHLARALEIVAKSGQSRPAGFGERGPTDYRRMLELKDLDA